MLPPAVKGRTSAGFGARQQGFSWTFLTQQDAGRWARAAGGVVIRTSAGWLRNGAAVLVPGFSGNSHFDVQYLCQNQLEILRAGWSRRRLAFWVAVLFLLAGVPGYGQQGGAAGVAEDAARAVQPPLLISRPVQALPQIAMPMPPPPVLATQPAADPRARGHARKIEAKYDVTRIGERGIGGGFDFYSLEHEQEMGRELAREVEAGVRLIHDPVVTEYVNRVGQNIVRNSDARVTFTIKVIDDADINAFALPGGFFYVNSGLILASENEAELAGVMAHEIAHVAARHGTKNATRMQLLNLASLPLIFFGGPAGYVLQQVAGLAVPMSFLKFSRDAEREADLLGLEYEYACGYDPQEFVKFFEKLKLEQKKKGSFLSRAFATHPMTSDRIDKAQEAIERYLPSRAQYIVNTSEFDEVKARLTRLMDAQILTADARPTLRRRVPRVDSGKKDDNGPVLRRRQP